MVIAAQKERAKSVSKVSYQRIFQNFHTAIPIMYKTDMKIRKNIVEINIACKLHESRKRKHS